MLFAVRFAVVMLVSVTLVSLVLGAETKPEPDDHRRAHIDFTIRSTGDGIWSDPNTWQPACLPRDGDRVLITRGTRVIYDVNSEAKLRLVQVVGTLRFARDRDTLPVMMPDGKERETDIRTIPFYRFADNETHTEGLYGVAIAGTDLASPDRRHPHVVKDLTIWNVHYALRPHVPKMWIENVKINHATYGIYRPELDHHVYRNLYLTRLSARALGRAGRADGHGAGTPAIQHGPVTYENVTLENVHTDNPPVAVRCRRGTPQC